MHGEMYLLFCVIFALVTAVSLQGILRQDDRLLPPSGCNCPVPGQYDLVCANDGKNYKNKELVECYRRCVNASLQITKIGKCGNQWKEPSHPLGQSTNNAENVNGGFGQSFNGQNFNSGLFQSMNGLGGNTGFQQSMNQQAGFIPIWNSQGGNTGFQQSMNQQAGFIPSWNSQGGNTGFQQSMNQQAGFIPSWNSQGGNTGLMPSWNSQDSTSGFQQNMQPQGFPTNWNPQALNSGFQQSTGPQNTRFTDNDYDVLLQQPFLN